MSDDKFFKYAIILSCVVHAVLFIRLYIEKKNEREITSPEMTYELTPPEKKEVKSEILAQKVSELEPIEKIEAETQFPLNGPESMKDFLNDMQNLTQDLDVYERQPERLKGLKVTKEVSVPMLKSEKINTPAYVTYYQIVRDRIRDRAYTNYTRMSVGEIFLSFIVLKDGTLGALQVLEDRSSANDFLRRVGMKSVQEGAPFPAFPEDLDYPELTFNVQISFQYREE